MTEMSENSETLRTGNIKENVKIWRRMEACQDDAKT